MDWTRRRMIAALGVGSGLAGCSSVLGEQNNARQSPEDGPAGDRSSESMTVDSTTSVSDVATYFKNGRLTAPVDNTTVRSDTIQTDEVTMFVDPNGDDDADGLTRDTAKRTLHAAVRDAPLHGNGMKRLVLDLAPGRYTDEGRSNLDLRDTTISSIHILGESNKGPKSIIDAGDSTYAIGAFGNCYLRIENTVLTGGIQPLGASYGSYVQVINSSIIAGNKTRRTAYVTNGSTIDIDKRSLIDLTKSKQNNKNWSLAVTGVASAKIDGILRGDADSVLIGKESSWVFLSEDAIIDGVNKADKCVRIHKDSNIKVDGPKIRNARLGVLGGVNSTISVRTPPDFDGLDNHYRTRVGTVFEEDDTSKQWIHLPSNEDKIEENNIDDPIGIHYLDSLNNTLKMRVTPAGYVDAPLWTEVESGTVNIPGGEKEIISTDLGKNKPCELIYTISEMPSKYVELQKIFTVNPDTGQVEWGIKEMAGNSSATVNYTILKLESYR